jgi:hypothetical protein
MSILVPRCHECATPLEVFEGKPYCPDCTSYCPCPPDLAEEPDAAAGYEEWLGELAAREELADLREWARQTLQCAPLPCVCLNKTCLRCRVSAIVS